MTVATTASADVVASPLSVVCNFWRELDLEAMRTKLDEVGLKVAEHQEESMQHRRKLAEATRDFKRNNEAVSKTVGLLLKQYQEEIDRLTKRAKHGETAFLDLYQKLYEAPDPAPSLALAFENATRATDLEAQCKKMAQELAEYRAESAQIKNQDLTVRKLEERVRGLEAQLEEKDTALVEVRERAVAEADAARVAQMHSREEELTAMLAQAHASLSNLQKLHTTTQNQLFAMQSQSEEERMGRQTELELASAELERAQERLAALEREKHSLVQQLGASAGPGGPAGSGAAGSGGMSGGTSLEESLRQELSTQRELASRLRMELAATRRESDEARSMLEAKVEGLKATLTATEQHAQALEQDLASRPTQGQMEELRQQLRVLQAIGYNSLDMEDDHNAGTSAGTAGSASATEARASSNGAVGTRPPGSSGSGLGAAASLEALLLSKNRHLEHELTMLKLKLVDLRQEADASAAQVAELEAQLHDKEALVRQLEEDLLASRSAEQRLTGAASGDLLRAPSGGGLADDADGGAEDGNASMLRVLCAQRDRFRVRVHDLEEELTKARAELMAAKNDATAARADNIALVERLRYVHSRTAAAPKADVEAGAEAERRYGRLYDENINPFKEFKEQQKERQKTSMGFADKAMYMFAQLVFGSSSARLFTFVYLSVMHLLVFVLLMRMTHHSSSQILEHTQAVLDNRHDVTSTMHHELEERKLP